MANTPQDELWRLKRPRGRRPKFKRPYDLWARCVKYFEWVKDNPLYEMKAYPYQGEITKTELPKMRAMTITGLCLHLGISFETWSNYREKPEFFEVTTQVENIIYEQKFTGAAAELLNPKIIARDLGLKEAHEHSGPDGAPIPHNVQVTFVDSEED